MIIFQYFFETLERVSTFRFKKEAPEYMLYEMETVVDMDGSSPNLKKRKIKLLKMNEVENYQRLDRDLTDSPTTAAVSLDIHKAIMDKKDQENNSYCTSKSYSQNILNTAVMQSQIFTLVNLFSLYSGKSSEIALVTLLSLSLVLQFVIFVLLVLLARAKDEQLTETLTATGLNAFITSLTFLLLIVTTAITAVSKITNLNILNATSV